MRGRHLGRIGCLIGRGQCVWVTDKGNGGTVQGFRMRHGEMVDWFWSETPSRTYCLHCGRRR